MSAAGASIAHLGVESAAPQDREDDRRQREEEATGNGACGVRRTVVCRGHARGGAHHQRWLLHGAPEDSSGPAVVELLEAAGVAEVVTETLPDEVDLIAAALRRLAANAELIVTTAAPGLAARDVTPEATRLVCDRLVDGLAERMRAEGLRQTPLAALSRGVCGTVASADGSATLIVNLPGSPAGRGHVAGGDPAAAAACAGSAGGADGTLKRQLSVAGCQFERRTHLHGRS